MDRNIEDQERQNLFMRIQGEQAITEYLGSIEGWNFVQGNVIDENMSLRRNDRLKTIALIILAILIPIGAIVYSNIEIFSGNPRVIAVPINAANGTIVGPAQLVSRNIPRPGKAIDRYIVQQASIAILEVTPIRDELNANVIFLDKYISPSAASTITDFRSANNNAESPYTLAQEGYSGFPLIKSIVNLSGNIWVALIERTLQSQYPHVHPINQMFTLTFQIDAGNKRLLSKSNPFGIIIDTVDIKEGQQ